jgi:hypothetical protein
MDVFTVDLAIFLFATFAAKVGDQKSFQKNLDAFQKAGYIFLAERKRPIHFREFPGPARAAQRFPAMARRANSFALAR